MLSLMNEVDPCLLLLLCVLYEMQNQIFQQGMHEIISEVILNIRLINKIYFILS